MFLLLEFKVAPTVHRLGHTASIMLLLVEEKLGWPQPVVWEPRWNHQHYTRWITSLSDLIQHPQWD